MTEQFHFSPYTIQRLRHLQSLLDQLQPEAESRAFIAPGSPQPRNGVIVFPGSFNPPTTAHLALLKQARQFVREHEPLSLYAAFSKRTVDKEAVERPLLLDRIMLLDLVLRRHIAHTGIMLFNRGLYVEEAQAIRRSFPRVKRIVFLLGFDKIVQILDPRYYKDRDASLSELFRLAELLVAPRGNDGEQELSDLLHQEQNKRFAHSIHSLPFTSAYRTISSSDIRQGVAGSDQDVPQEVRQFIRRTRAYSAPLQQRDGTTIDYYGQRMRYLQQIVRGSL
jgi:nicotinic acid mononucleotide adenylyltransferase